MAVLKDTFCTNCNAVGEHLMDSDQVATFQRCPKCREMAHHESRCTGGRKSRWRYMDWGGFDATGAAVYEGCAAETDDEHGSAYTEADGTPVHNALREGFEDRIGQKRDKKNHASRAERGRNPLFFHNGATSAP